jgi:hypothetical protein
MKIRLTMAAFVAAVSCLTGASAAGAQTHQNGLVNLNLENVTVQVPIGVAANVCDVNVAVLANLVDTGTTQQCTALANTDASAVTVGAPTGTIQNGLVNVNLSNVTVQVPIAAAVNICDVNAAVLAALSDVAGSSCDATATSHS